MPSPKPPDAGNGKLQAAPKMKKLLEGPRRPSDPEAAYQGSREKYGWSDDLSALTDEELADRYEAGLAALPPDKAAEAQRMGLL